MTSVERLVAPLEGRSATLFLLGGTLFVVFAASTGARTFAGQAFPTVHDVFGPAAFFVGILGLYGLWPALVRRTRRLAVAAGLVAVIPAVGWFVLAAIGVGEAVGVLPDASVVLPGVAFIPVFLTTILAYFLFAAGSRRAGIHSRPVGLLLLGPGIVILVLIVGMGVLATVSWAEFVLDAGHAVAHLAIGLALRAEARPAGRPQTADATS